MRLGVFSVVHHADDVRIREKLIPSLPDDAEVHYHTRLPGPTDGAGLQWHPLEGSRVARNVELFRRLWARRVDIAVLVDPETFVAGIVASRRVHVVFDIHENVPAQIRTKQIPMRRMIAWLAKRILFTAERVGSVTLAEPGYAGLFRREHSVFENYPIWSRLPDRAASDGSVVYVGDITVERGALDISVAAAENNRRLVMVGRCDPKLEAEIEGLFDGSDGSVEFTGRLPWGQAMERLSSAAVAVSPLHDTPNYRRSLPTKVLEYVGLGIPVVATRLPGTSEFLDGLAGTALVEPGNREELSLAIEEMSTAEAREAVQASREIVRTAYVWPTDRVSRFYAELAGVPGRLPDR